MNTENVFFIIGAQRSGTTYLYLQMEHHPEICMAKPLKPEPKYFLEGQIPNKDEYFKKYFASYNPEIHSWRGEKTTSYIEYPESGKKIATLFPNAKLVLVLRNPVYRALSNYFFTKGFGLETRTPKETFLDLVPKPLLDKKISTDPFAYLERGQYLGYLKEYLRFFEREKLGIFLYENLTVSKEEVQKVYSFVGVNPSVEPLSPDDKINESESFEIDAEIIEAIKSYYRPHNEKLSEYLKMDLTKVWDY